ncbi:hypothetical protein [Kibdelosporangium philippinense]|uniref:hypothetical protein n=1 Tax=Kibdelosporangium philippinense TaxID=211113 RepID=UPI003606AC2A
MAAGGDSGLVVSVAGRDRDERFVVGVAGGVARIAVGENHNVVAVGQIEALLKQVAADRDRTVVMMVVVWFRLCVLTGTTARCIWVAG